MKRVLFVSSEVYPFAKSGGLADVSSSLPKELSTTYNVDTILPLYSSIDRIKHNITYHNSISFVMAEVSYQADIYTSTYNDLTYYFFYHPILCDREFLYGSADSGYVDNDIRFGLFCYGVSVIAKEYNLVHLNDWQSALVALLLKDCNTKSIFTIHNLAYQGQFPKSSLYRLGLSDSYFHHDELEFYGDINLLKAGIKYSDAITTVSPTYAKEIQTKEFGFGLDGFLQKYSYKLSGILNAIDTRLFDPKNDPYLNKKVLSYKSKMHYKKEALKLFGLKDDTKALFVFIGRLTYQKGLDLLVETLKATTVDANFIFLGSGESRYENLLKHLVIEHQNIAFKSMYDEGLSHKLYAGADFLLMPSLFEPCGLNQFIAMRYGAIPITTKVGGLNDSIKNITTFKEDLKYSYGFLLSEATSKKLTLAITKAITLYNTDITKVAKHNMLIDYSWSSSAKKYLQIYKKLI